MILNETKYNQFNNTNNLYKNLYYLHELEIKYNLLNNPQFKTYWFTDPEQGEEKYYHAQERKQVINPFLKKQIKEIGSWVLSYYYIVLSSWYQGHNYFSRKYPYLTQVQRVSGSEYDSTSNTGSELASVDFPEYLTLDSQKGPLWKTFHNFDNRNSQNDISIFQQECSKMIGGMSENFEMYANRALDRQFYTQLEKLIHEILNTRDIDILDNVVNLTYESNELDDDDYYNLIYNDPDGEIQSKFNNPDGIINVLNSIIENSTMEDKYKLLSTLQQIVFSDSSCEFPISTLIDTDDLLDTIEQQISIKDETLPGDYLTKDRIFYSYIETVIRDIRKVRMKELKTVYPKMRKILKDIRVMIIKCYEQLIELKSDNFKDTSISHIMVTLNHVESMVHSNGTIVDYMSPRNLWITPISQVYPIPNATKHLYPNIYKIMVTSMRNFDLEDTIGKMEDFEELVSNSDFDIESFDDFKDYLTFLSRLDKKQPKIYNKWIDDLVSYGLTPEIKKYMGV